jgi:hypothetical protein
LPHPDPDGHQGPADLDPEYGRSAFQNKKSDPDRTKYLQTPYWNTKNKMQLQETVQKKRKKPK